MFRATLVTLACAVNVHAHGSGAWKDPHHMNTGVPFAGMRYVSESPPHILTLVGSNDGSKWFTLKGFCTGDDMTSIHFDFSPLGGPSELVAKWVKHSDNSVTLNFADGNSWLLTTATFDSNFVDPPPAGPGELSAESAAHSGRSAAPGLLAGGALVAVAAAAGVAFKKSRPQPDHRFLEAGTVPSDSDVL